MLEVRLPIARYWHGSALPPAHHGAVTVRACTDALLVAVDAPHFADPPPPGPPGPTPRLWEHEVVELFLAGADDRYFELELGPSGHHLALVLRGVRKVARDVLPIEYAARIDARGWRFEGHARVPWSYLPKTVTRGNAYAIHGAGDRRCHHAHAPVPGAVPDFHRLDCFVPLRLS